MKKIQIILIIIIGIIMSSCYQKEDRITVLTPSGTPSLGISAYLFENTDTANYQIVSGSDPLVSAFINKTYDIIIAPVNLGAKMYKNNQNYILYKTFVWGNTYIVSNKNINDIFDLNGEKIVAFGENSTPGIVLKSLFTYYNIDCEIQYVDDVASANAMLMTGKANTILSAEPSLSKINSKQLLNVVDLQEAWKNMTGSYSYPQAAIFVKKESYEKNIVKIELTKMINSIKSTKNPDDIAKKAVGIDESFSKLGIEVLKKAIPNCNFFIDENQKSAIEFYFTKLNELGLSAMYGDDLPKEEFYAKN